MSTLLLLVIIIFPTLFQESRSTETTDDVMKVESIGTSRGGRQMELVVLADPPEKADQRPGILIVAGLDGRHELGSKLARGIAEGLAEDHRELLSETTFYILPLANPDARADGNRRGSSRLIDQDRDGILDEDPPRDLDGNGIITMMRRANPPLEDKATHLADPADGRLMIKPDHGKGEQATHSMHVEGLDADGDGLIAEDGMEGVDLDRNFMHRWPEYALDAGPYQLSEYETRAISRFVIDHPNLIAAVVYGPHDNLINQPDSKSMDITGRTPKELLGKDKDDHQKASDRYKELVGQERSAKKDDAGSLHGWLYAHRGLPTHASTGWGRPDPSEPEAEPGEDPEAGVDERPEPRDKEEAAWLAYSDRDRDGVGFIEWTAYDHPQLGMVEIGGWVPGFRMNPPDDVVAELIPRHTTWIADIADRQARLKVIGPEIESLGGGLARVRIGLQNTGLSPTRTHQAVKTRVGRPINVRIGIPPEQLVQGRLLEQIERIDPGELVTREWMVRLGPDRMVSIDIDDQAIGRITVANTMENDS
ncbi:MAG: M14 family zinc carboxypeptidase [Phycisphaerales bacterium]|nr:M14 family zinc carboxypeptidase [Phycisphaerales bacterium]